jgi:hypothetical protein
MQRLSYTVDEDSDGFAIRTSWIYTTWETYFSTVFISIFVWLFTRGFLPHWLSYTLAPAAAATNLFYKLRKNETYTTITRYEVRPTGQFPNNYKPASFVPLANIVYLTFRKEEPRGEDESLPAGLWAELERGSECLVPGITNEEADALTYRIEKRFANIIGSAIPPGHSTGHITTLGLSSQVDPATST